MPFADVDLTTIIDSLGTPGSVGAAPVKGIFRQPTRVMDLESGAMQYTDPTYRMKNSDIAAWGITRGTIITIGDVSYSVTTIDPDNTGSSTLSLTTDY